MLKTPEEIRSFPYKNVITQAMGTQAKIEPDVYAIHASHGDIVILCSDGVTDELEDGEMAQIITEHGRDVISFNVGDIHHMDMGTLLDKLGFEVRTGHHCAQPLMNRYGVQGMVSASFAAYNTVSLSRAIGAE